MADIFIGLMSGTSVDGVDAAMLDEHTTTLLAQAYQPYPSALKQQLKALTQGGQTSLKKLTEIDKKVAYIFAESVKILLKRANVKPESVKAIGSHGQTIFHQGGKYSMQIGHGAFIAEQTGITTVSDFRMQDIAAGGQGAPLTPLYHQHILSGKDGTIINLGGIANITLVKNSVVSGFDTGPANTLLDNWIKKNKKLEYDKAGAWARCGRLDPGLLANLLADEYFHKSTPKSTGVEYFNLDWLANYLTDHTPADTQRTLLELTARSISAELPTGVRVYLCGGGTHNAFLLERLSLLNPQSKITTTKELGVEPDYVEAAAFAYFAKLKLANKPANLPEVTGAQGKRLLGAVYLSKNH